MKMVKSEAFPNGFPRRNRTDLHTPTERAIRAAEGAIERVGADPRLTDALLLCQKARELVADWSEEDETRLAVVPPAPSTTSAYKELISDLEEWWRHGGSWSGRLAARAVDALKEMDRQLVEARTPAPR